MLHHGGGGGDEGGGGDDCVGDDCVRRMVVVVVMVMVMVGVVHLTFRGNDSFFPEYVVPFRICIWVLHFSVLIRPLLLYLKHGLVSLCIVLFVLPSKPLSTSVSSF